MAKALTINLVLVKPFTCHCFGVSIVNFQKLNACRMLESFEIQENICVEWVVN